MNELQLLQYLSGLVPWGPTVLVILGCLVVIGQVVVALTPSTADDAAWEKLQAIPVLGGFLKALAMFAPLQKKDPSGK